MRLSVVFLSFQVAFAQAYGQVITGSIADRATGHFLSGVSVSTGALKQVTDTSGRFVLPLGAPGRISVSVRRVGYAPRDSAVVVAQGDSIHLTILLDAVPAQLDTVAVSATSPGRNLLPEFEERRARGFGRFITRDELRREEHRTLTDIIKSRFPNITIQNDAGAEYLFNRSQPAPRSLRSPKPCYLQIVMDGISVYRAGDGQNMPPDFALLLAREYDAIEYYSSPSRTPLQYRSTGASCGTLILWSRRQ